MFNSESNTNLLTFIDSFIEIYPSFFKAIKRIYLILAQIINRIST